MIVPPVVIEDRDGYLGLFQSVDEAVANMDLDDVLDREFVAYDSEGRLLSVLPTSGGDSVATIELDEPVPGHQDQLRAALLQALRLRLGDAAGGIDALSLPELIETALRRRRGYWLP
jgi:hypothetical protein